MAVIGDRLQNEYREISRRNVLSLDIVVKDKKKRPVVGTGDLSHLENWSQWEERG